MKRQNSADQYFNEVISYGGFPLRRGDVITDLDNERHPLPPNTEPITLAEFYRIVGESAL